MLSKDGTFYGAQKILEQDTYQETVKPINEHWA